MANTNANHQNSVSELDVNIRMRPWGGNWWTQNRVKFEMPKPIKSKLTNKNMIVYQLEGKATLYLPLGNLLIPFNVDWEDYLKDFRDATTVVLVQAEFDKFTVVEHHAIKSV